MGGGNPENVDESLLLKQVIDRKDKNALAFFHDRYSAHIRQYVITCIGSVADADDLTQNVFVELSRSDGRYDGDTDVEKYLFGIANNVVRRYFRQKAGSVKTVHFESINNLSGGDARPLADPAYKIESEELRKNISRTIAKLPPKSREAVKLRFIDGLSTKQAAEKAGCDVVTLRKRISRGLEMIRLRLDL